MAQRTPLDFVRTFGDCASSQLDSQHRGFPGGSRCRNRCSSQKGQVAQHHRSYRGIQCGEELVFGKNITFTDHVH